MNVNLSITRLAVLIPLPNYDLGRIAGSTPWFKKINSGYPSTDRALLTNRVHSKPESPQLVYKETPESHVEGGYQPYKHEALLRNTVLVLGCLPRCC